MQMPIEVEKVATLTGHRDCIYTLEKGNKGVIYSAGGDGLVAEWNLNQENPDQGQLVARVENSVYALCFVPEKGQLLVGQNFKGIHLIDVVNKKELTSAAITSSGIFDIKVTGDLILTATGDGTIVVMSLNDLSTITRLKVSEASVRCIAVNRYRNEFAAGCSDNYIRVFSLENFNLVKEIHAHSNSVFSVIYSSEGRQLLSAGRDAHLTVWDADDKYNKLQSIVAHMYAVNHIAFREDGRYFATGSMDKSVKIWSAEQYRLLKVIDKARHAGHGTSVNKVLWNGLDQVISCSDDRTISIWKIKGLEQ
jgi:WD40 repeat protein